MYKALSFQENYEIGAVPTLITFELFIFWVPVSPTGFSLQGKLLPARGGSSCQFQRQTLAARMGLSLWPGELAVCPEL